MNAKIDIGNVILASERLTLRPWRETDLGDLYEYASVDGVGQMAGWIPHRNMEESRMILSRFIDGRRIFAIEHNGKAVGSLGIEDYDEDEHPELDGLRGRQLGYVLSKTYWGQGLMPEAVKTVIGYLFDTVGLDFITVRHYDWNTQSRRVIEKCGFRYVRTTKRKTQYGTAENSLEYILFRTEREAQDAYT